MKIDDDVEPAPGRSSPHPPVFDDAGQTARSPNDDHFVELWVAGNTGAACVSTR